MSEPTPIVEEAGAGEEDWQVRRATPADVAAVAGAVRELLFELGGKPASGEELQRAARSLVEDERAGLLLVAEAQGKLIGFLGVSWQQAVRTAGRYALIQELWVTPAWRSRAVGAELMNELVEVAREESVRRIEVGLPSERFPSLEATRAFYETHGFTAIGLRMKRVEQ